MNTITKTPDPVTDATLPDTNTTADNIISRAAAADKNTQKIINGGTSAKYQPRAWSYGGQID